MTDDSVETVYYYYDPMGRVICEYEESGGSLDEVRSFVYGNGIDEVLAMFEPEPAYDPNDEDEFYDVINCWLCDSNDVDWNDCYVYDANDNDVIDLIDFGLYTDDWDLPTFKETRWYYLHDALGSVAGLVGGNYQREDDREFYIYGVYGTPDGLSEVGNPYMFTGRRVDEISDGCCLQYNRNRHYSYNLMRWISPDPLGVTVNPQKPNAFNPTK